MLFRSTRHLTAAKRVLRFLRSTAHHRLFFSSEGNSEMTGYTDSDWANDCADRKSQGGNVFILNNGAISWQSRKQDLVASSTTEAEYIACSEASREARWLRKLQRDIDGIPATDKPVGAEATNQLPDADLHRLPGRARAHHRH